LREMWGVQARCRTLSATGVHVSGLAHPQTRNHVADKTRCQFGVHMRGRLCGMWGVQARCRTLSATGVHVSGLAHPQMRRTVDAHADGHMLVEFLYEANDFA
jgi:hypothetical protein